MFLKHKNLDKERFLAAAGVKKGYARDMFERMYDALTVESIDMIREFEKYYQVEYENLGKYLFRKWNLSYEMTTEIMNSLNDNPDLVLYRRIERSYQHSDLRRFLSEDPMVERIEKILLMK